MRPQLMRGPSSLYSSSRPRRRRQESWSSCETMGSIPQSPSVAKSTASMQARNTGFPEPFCGSRNTTLPHPDAIVSPDASITAEDISVSKAMNRSRRSLLSHHNKYKRTLCYGRITPEEMYHAEEGMAGAETEALVHPPISRLPSIVTNSTADIRPSTMDSSDGRRSSSGHVSAPIATLAMTGLPSPTSSTSSRRRSILRKFRWSRD